MVHITQDYILSAPVPRRRKMRAGPLAPTMVEIWAVTNLLMAYIAVDTLFGAVSYRSLNYGGPLALVLILGYANWHMIRADAKSIWTALFWFRLSTAVYFGVGTMLVYLVNDFTLLYMQSFYTFYDDDVFKHNIIVTLSVILVLVTARLVLLAVKPKITTEVPRDRGKRDRALLVGAVVILGLGLTTDYIFVIPYRLGWSSFVLPGSIMNLTKLIPVGIFLLTLWGLRNARWLVPAIFGLTAVEMLFSLLFFAKEDFLLMLIMVALAFVWDRVTLKRTLILGVVVIGAYFTIKPIIDYARDEIGLRYGANTQAGFSERFEIISSYFSEGGHVRGDSELQAGLSRLSYVNAATFLVHLYDSGHPGDWPELLPVVFIPRILWKDKPIITNLGVHIYELGTGRRSSSSGAGLFAEAYWAWGWWGVIVFMSAYGIVIGRLTQFSSNIMQQGRWLYFPVVLLGLRYGMRTDGHYISDAAGALVILVVFYFLTRVLDTILKLMFKQKYR